MNSESVDLTRTPGPRGADKRLNIALWVLQGMLALTFFGASSGKLLGRPEMVALFDAIGVGQWFRYVTGVCELAGAVTILVPRTRFWGVSLLASVMVGAIATHLAILHTSPAGPVILLLLAGAVLWGRRSDVAGRAGYESEPRLAP